jgi:hypothetical protein
LSSTVLTALSLPSSLEEDRLVILFAAWDGSYEDHYGNRQYLSKSVSGAIRRMEIGQKVLIFEEGEGGREEKDREEFLENWTKERRIWSVRFLYFKVFC